jgi:hypothetical protein
LSIRLDCCRLTWRSAVAPRTYGDGTLPPVADVYRRRTGVTLKDTGVRDEHGLEPIEGIFSSPARSPEKSPTKSNGAARNSTITTEEEMEIGNSTLESYPPEPSCDQLFFFFIFLPALAFLPR